MPATGWDCGVKRPLPGGIWWLISVVLPFSWLLLAKRRFILKRTDEQVHRVRQLGDLFNLPEPPAPHVWTTDHHHDEARKRLPDGQQIIGIGPVTNWRAKTWRPAHFIELTERLTASNGLFPNARIAVFGGPDERDDARPVLDAIPADRLIDLVGAISLLTAAACLKRCDIYIGNDSAVMHLAAAAGIPTVGLFGPQQRATLCTLGVRQPGRPDERRFRQHLPGRFRSPDVRQPDGQPDGRCG